MSTGMGKEIKNYARGPSQRLFEKAPGSAAIHLNADCCTLFFCRKRAAIRSVKGRHTRTRPHQHPQATGAPCMNLCLVSSLWPPTVPHISPSNSILGDTIKNRKEPVQAPLIAERHDESCSKGRATHTRTQPGPLLLWPLTAPHITQHHRQARAVARFGQACSQGKILVGNVTPTSDELRLDPLEFTQGERQPTARFGKRKKAAISSVSPSNKSSSISHLARSPASLRPFDLVRIDPMWPCFACRGARAKCK